MIDKMKKIKRDLLGVIAGFGLGIERTVAWLCGLEHVRETIPFPRLMDRLYP